AIHRRPSGHMTVMTTPHPEQPAEGPDTPESPDPHHAPDPSETSQDADDPTGGRDVHGEPDQPV
ncbi:hypothetical protein, partial [Aeromicrobium phragmitis]